MRRFLKILATCECGQDLVEYSLLLAFVALASTGLLLGSGKDVHQIWSSANSVLSRAATTERHHGD
jgi:Flp pilus assembly pilin Flp